MTLPLETRWPARPLRPHRYPKCGKLGRLYNLQSSHDSSLLTHFCTLYRVIETILYTVQNYKKESRIMTMEYSGSGDPGRTMALLWGTPKRPGRGPKPGLSVEQIVDAAIEVADAEGLAALSMRRVADRLGVGTMSLYTYVPGKAELLDLMLDTVLAEEARPDGAGGWRAGLELRAREDWALFHRHPWILQITPGRSLLGPNETDLFEATLRVVDGIGLG